MTHFTLSTVIRAPKKVVFHFYDDPNNLPKITPPDIRVDVVRFDPPAPDARIILRVHPFPLMRTRWEIRLSRYEPYDVYEDMLVSGPFRTWRHTRTLEENQGMTMLSENVEYELPFTFFGKMADSLLVRRMTMNMFSYRQQKTKELLETAN